MILEDKEEIKAFIEYANKETTEQEKEQLTKALEFYKKHKPVWTDKHTKIIEEYEKLKKEGKIKEIVLIPKTC